MYIIITGLGRYRNFETNMCQAFVKCLHSFETIAIGIYFGHDYRPGLSYVGILPYCPGRVKHSWSLDHLSDIDM